MYFNTHKATEETPLSITGGSSALTPIAIKLPFFNHMPNAFYNNTF